MQQQYTNEPHTVQRTVFFSSMKNTSPIIKMTKNNNKRMLFKNVQARNVQIAPECAQCF